MGHEDAFASTDSIKRFNSARVKKYGTTAASQKAKKMLITAKTNEATRGSVSARASKNAIGDKTTSTIANVSQKIIR